MADCNHDCAHCNSNCGERKEIQKDKPNELSKIKKVIGIVSGKGGVGKSLVTSMLAVALNRRGLKTAVLDADITGPSIPKAFGVTQKAFGNELGIMPAVTETGIEMMSVNLLLENDSDPVLWRGPVIGGTVRQFWTEVVWNDVDVMFVDMPPGTGDIQLTLSQSSPLTGAVVVTTPQDIALIDAKKGLKMFEKVNVPLLGIVENMSVFICPCCGEVTHIFGEGGAKRMSEQYGVPMLGELPLSPAIREAADSGRPTVAAEPESVAAKMYRAIAMKIAGSIAKLGKDYTARMPTISVKND